MLIESLLKSLRPILHIIQVAKNKMHILMPMANFTALIAKLLREPLLNSEKMPMLKSLKPNVSQMKKIMLKYKRKRTFLSKIRNDI